MSEAPTTVVIVDDHGLVWRGLEQLLAAEPDVRVVGSAADGAEALDVVARTGPDVVLMDLQMPGMDGTEATRRLLADSPERSVVVLTSFSDRERIVAAMEAGAVGYLLKDAEPAELVAGIRAAARAESPLHPRAARALLTWRRSQAGSQNPLTEREREVLDLVRRGFWNKQVPGGWGSVSGP